MSLFLRIPDIDPSEHTVENVAKAAWEALQVVEQREPSDWTPKKRRQLDTAWQVDRANTWQVLRMSKGFELFSYYGEDSTAAKIIAMIPDLLEKIERKSLKQKSDEDWHSRNPVQFIPNPSRSIVQY
jgi:hypothetical protein